MGDRSAGPTGLRHVALRVRDVARSSAFYRTHFEMRVVWEPDDESTYLSSGGDSLALHQDPAAADGGRLDHLGFFVATPDDVHAKAAAFHAAGVDVIAEPREHRDGSVSCYCKDPDGNVVQVLWIPDALR